MVFCLRGALAVGHEEITDEIEVLALAANVEQVFGNNVENEVLIVHIHGTPAGIARGRGNAASSCAIHSTALSPGLAYPQV